MSAPNRALAAVLGIVVIGGVVAGGYVLIGSPRGSDQTAAATSSPTPSGASPPPASATPTASASARATATATPAAAAPILGADGRFTVLLLGSDYRSSSPGNRTDAIMVVSVDPATGKAAAFSVPRDTTAFPLPGGGVFDQKVNALYQHLLATTPDGNTAMKRAISEAFGIEIDSYVFIGFAGVRGLVYAVGGVDVTLERAYYDPAYWVTASRQGWGLPAGRSHLDGDDALIFARSRKGDNDFGRARRQQLLVMAALTRVRSLGPSVLPKLLGVAARTVRTDLPLASAGDLFALLATADLRHAKRTVFGPTAFATGTPGGAFSLKIKACRTWIARNFPKAEPRAAWPPVSPAP